MRGVHDEKLKHQAIALRRKGYSYPMIVKVLSVPRATLSGWLSELRLSVRVKGILLKRKKQNLVAVREKALVVLQKNRQVASHSRDLMIAADYDNFGLDKRTKELLLAMLYLGEGFKRVSVVGLGNSNSDICKMFVRLLKEIYNVPDEKFRCFLHLRMDQNSEEEKKYWSRKLGLSEQLFRKSQFDRRTQNSKTWSSYHGVCSVYCYDAVIEKRITALQKFLVKKILGG